MTRQPHLQRDDLPVECLELRRLGLLSDPESGSCLVDELQTKSYENQLPLRKAKTFLPTHIDGLVGKETIRDVCRRKRVSARGVLWEENLTHIAERRPRLREQISKVRTGAGPTRRRLTHPSQEQRPRSQLRGEPRTWT